MSFPRPFCLPIRPLKTPGADSLLRRSWGSGGSGLTGTACVPSLMASGAPRRTSLHPVGPGGSGRGGGPSGLLCFGL